MGNFGSISDLKSFPLHLYNGNSQRRRIQIHSSPPHRAYGLNPPCVNIIYKEAVQKRLDQSHLVRSSLNKKKFGGIHNS